MEQHNLSHACRHEVDSDADCGCGCGAVDSGASDLGCGVGSGCDVGLGFEEDWDFFALDFHCGVVEAVGSGASDCGDPQSQQDRQDWSALDWEFDAEEVDSASLDLGCGVVGWGYAAVDSDCGVLDLGCDVLDWGCDVLGGCGALMMGFGVVEVTCALAVNDGCEIGCDVPWIDCDLLLLPVEVTSCSLVAWAKKLSQRACQRVWPGLWPSLLLLHPHGCCTG